MTPRGRRRLAPLIRYEISDRVSWADPSEGCRWEGQWINPPQGRSDDVFRYGTGGEVVALDVARRPRDR